MTITTEQLDELDQLEKAATPGPWDANELHTHDGLQVYDADLALVIATRNALSELVAELRLAKVYATHIVDEQDAKDTDIDILRANIAALTTERDTTLAHVATVLSEIETLRAELATVRAERDHFETQCRASRVETLSLKSQVQQNRRGRK